MKKTIILFLWATASIGLSTSCYDDKSTYATNPIEALSIQTDGESTYRIGYLEPIDITPEVFRGSTSQPDGLEYLWEIGDDADTQPDTYRTLGTEPELHTIINSPIATQPYMLRLTVTDKLNGDLQAVQVWSVYVQSSFTDGLLVSDTHDNVTSDFTLIKNSTLTTNYNKEEKIYRNILQETTGESYNRLITSLTYNVFSNKLNQIWATTSDGYCVRFDTENFTENGNADSEDLIVYKPDGIKFYSFFKAQQFFFANTSAGIYSFNPTAANTFGWIDAEASAYSIDNNIVAVYSNNNVAHQCAVWFDAHKECFVSFNGMYIIPQYSTDFQSNSYFDPQHMSGYTAIAAGMSTDGLTPTFLMKEKTTGQYSLLTFSRHQDAVGEWKEDSNGEWYFEEETPEVPAGARMKYDIPSEGKDLLDKAVSIFFANTESIMYVATADGIYAITFAGSIATVNTTAKYAPINGEQITKAKLYQQGQYTNNADATFTELAWNNKAIIVATQKEEMKGKVYVIPMTQLGTGNLDAAHALIYEGFGKVLDIITTGY